MQTATKSQFGLNQQPIRYCSTLYRRNCSFKLRFILSDAVRHGEPEYTAFKKMAFAHVICAHRGIELATWQEVVLTDFYSFGQIGLCVWLLISSTQECKFGGNGRLDRSERNWLTAWENASIL